MTHVMQLQHPISCLHVFKSIETEVFEFLLTGKNDITDETLKTDST